MMNTFNTFILDITVSIIDFLYRGRDYQRFWVLEEIVRVSPYFAFLSVLHLRESLGLRGPVHIYLMEEHFAQTLNETEHLEYMESRGGVCLLDRSLFRPTPCTYLLLGQRGLLLGPRAAYNLSYGVELHAAETYNKFLCDHDDKRIEEIMQDELNHAEELHKAIEMIK